MCFYISEIPTICELKPHSEIARRGWMPRSSAFSAKTCGKQFATSWIGKFMSWNCALKI